MSNITLETAAQLLSQLDNVGVLVHRDPDGDCLGSGYALCLMLRKMGKRSQVLCSDDPSRNLSDFFKEYNTDDFEPESYISVDTATQELLGAYSYLAEKVDICFDHHPTNTQYAKNLLLYPNAAATAEVVYDLCTALNIDIDTSIATCIYIGILTDTGCFKYSATSAKTHTIAARLMQDHPEVDFSRINRLLFSVKSRERLSLECLATQGLRYSNNGRVAVMPVTDAMREETHVDDRDLDGIAPIPCNIEGVEIGVTVRQKENDSWRVSLRTAQTADASRIAAVFGGGGHVRAAGCTLYGDINDVIEQLMLACEKELEG